MVAKFYEGWSLEDMVESLRREYLEKSGWLASAEAKEAVDGEGPAPWITYPAAELLKRLARPEWSVFEYGAGNSTLWWAKRVASVVSVEHDPEWATRVAGQAPANASVLTASEADYPAAIRRAGPFDVVVIDGIARIECCAEAVGALKPSGFIIFDNSDRAEYQLGYELLRGFGFRRIDFWGLGPINPYGWCTSIFTRSLDIFP